MERIQQFADQFFSMRKSQKDVSSEAPTEPAIQEGRSEDLTFLLAPGKLEELIRKGRIPMRIGSISGEDSTMQPYYQLPPQDYNPEEIDFVYMSAAGAYSFVDKDKSQKIGPTFTLTQEQAQEIEERIAAEKERIQQS